jgi:hypothetical protein
MFEKQKRLEEAIADFTQVNWVAITLFNSVIRGYD